MCKQSNLLSLHNLKSVIIHNSQLRIKLSDCCHDNFLHMNNQLLEYIRHNQKDFDFTFEVNVMSRNNRTEQPQCMALKYASLVVIQCLQCNRF